jgi:predicted nucleotidyltransferase
MAATRFGSARDGFTPGPDDSDIDIILISIEFN